MSEITNTFTATCTVCGRTVKIVDGKEQPHTCRIEIVGNYDVE